MINANFTSPTGFEPDPLPEYCQACGRQLTLEISSAGFEFLRCPKWPSRDNSAIEFGSHDSIRIQYWQAEEWTAKHQPNLFDRITGKRK